MIKSIAAISYAEERLELTLNDPYEDGIAVLNVDGIGPAKATIHTSSIASNDGDAFNGARVGGRNISLTLGLLTQPDVERARHKLYRIFQPSREVKLEFHTDYRHLCIGGWVESIDPVIFTEKEEVAISIICPDPFFHGLGASRYEVFPFQLDEPNMEFEFQDPTPTSPTIEISKRKSESETLIDYSGDAETGVTITVAATGTVKNFSIWNRFTGEKFYVDTKYFDRIGQKTQLDKGDVVTITSQQGNKHVTLRRAGTWKEINIIQCIPLNNDWLTIRPGRNVMYFQAEEGRDNMLVSLEVEVRYSGV